MAVTDDENWTELASGTWEDNRNEKSAELTSGSYRYIKLVGTKTVSKENGKNFGSAAEIYLDYAVSLGEGAQE